MRTTLTVDDDLASLLASLARETGKPFRTVVNDAIRRGLAELTPAPPPFDYVPHSSPLKPGIDPRNFNELAGQLEEFEFLDKERRARAGK
jgi:hypothetical protein